jgi:hypothetical protein
VPFLEVAMWGFIISAVLLSKKQQQALSLGALISTIIVIKLNRHSQWYIMLLPLIAITVASVFSHVRAHIKSVLWQKIYLYCFLIIFVLGLITTITTLMRYHSNKSQIAFTEYVMDHTIRTDQIMLIWCNAGGYMFRESPKLLRKVWYGIGEERLPTTTIFQLINKAKPQYIISVHYSAWLKEFLEKHYVEKTSGFWERK